MSVVFTMRGDDEIVAFLEGLPAAVHDAILEKFRLRAADVSDRVKEKLSGEVLATKSGRLRRSIYSRVYSTASRVTWSVGSRGDVPYARIHEYGGHIPEHIIEPAKGRALRFIGKDGALRYARIVIQGQDSGGTTMPERSYLRSTLADQAGTVREEILAALRDSVDRRKAKRLLGRLS